MTKTRRTRLAKFIVTALALIMSLSCLGITAVFGDEETYVVKAGASDYKIVIPENAEGYENNAALEFQKFFKKATGFTLRITSDKDLSAGGKYFSIGETSFVPSAVSDDVSDNKSSGYVIKTVGDTVYLLGKTAVGTLNSVYGYLNAAFDFEYYFTDVYDLTSTSELTLSDVSDADVDPDIEFMSGPSNGVVMTNVSNKLRFNALSTAEVFIPLRGNTQAHNILRVIGDAFNSHKKWQSTDNQNTSVEDDGATVCFTAHGDEDERNALLETVFEVVKDGLTRSSANYCQLGTPDNTGFCGCDACMSQKSTYKNSGIMLKFCNDLCKMVYDWFKTEEGAPYERDFKIVMLAYQSTAEAPTNVTGYEVNDDYKVGAYIGFDDFGGSYPITDASVNRDKVAYVNNWADKTDVLMFWTYDVNFFHYCYPYDTSLYKQAYYQLIEGKGGELINDLSQYENINGGTAWSNLKNYISCKLRWNTSLDVDVLTENFFKACYKDGWENMKDVYDGMLSRWATLRNTYTSGADHLAIHNIFGDLAKTDFWPKATITGWIEKIEDALDDISGLESTDKAAYAKAYKLISAEMVSPLYMLIELYSDDYSSEALTGLKKDLKKYVRASGVKYHESGAKFNNLFEGWGI